MSLHCALLEAEQLYLIICVLQNNAGHFSLVAVVTYLEHSLYFWYIDQQVIEVILKLHD